MKKLRFIENFHIILWLLKDTCWLLNFKIGGIIMVIPTFIMALYLCYQTRKNLEYLLPNISVCCWIGANSIWMLGDFFDFNHLPFSLTSFLIGLMVIVYYFVKFSYHSND